MFSPDETLISASAAPHCGADPGAWEGEQVEVKRKDQELVVWCFEPSQPLGTISGLKETFIKRYTAERSSETEIRPEERSEKTESCWENL